MPGIRGAVHAPVRRLAALALFGLLGACGQGAKAPPPRSAPGTGGFGPSPPVAASPQPGGETAGGQHGPSPVDALRVLRDQVQLLRTSPSQGVLDSVASSLGALSVLETAVAPAQPEAGAGLSRRAQELRVAATGGGEPDGRLASTLEDAIDRATRARTELTTDPAVRAARRDIAALDPSAPVGKPAAAATALCSTGRVLGLAAGLSTAVSQLGDCGEGDAGETRPLAAQALVGELRGDVERLGRSSWEMALGAASALLDGLARGFDQAGLPPGHGQSLRTRAKELAGLDRLSLERSGRLREALGTALAGLDLLVQSRGPALEPWVASASRAVRGIDPRVPFGLERAPIQDAARSVVDAFAAAVALDPTCR